MPDEGTVRRFRKKPVVIEAVQFLGKPVRGVCPSDLECKGMPAHVHTAHAAQRVFLEVGDWIIPESNGHGFYPCKPAIFEATYEPA